MAGAQKQGAQLRSLVLICSEELRVGVPNCSDLPDRFRALSSTMWGFAALYIVISNSSQQLSLSEASLLEEARAAVSRRLHVKAEAEIPQDG